MIMEMRVGFVEGRRVSVEEGVLDWEMLRWRMRKR